jgi:hypothetical protein
MEWKVELDDDLNAVVKGINKYTGAPATDIRQSLMNLNDKQYEQWLEGYLSTRCSGIALQSYSISNVDTIEDPLIFDYNFKTELLTSQTENMAIIDLASILLMELPDYFRSNKREVAIEFRHGTCYELDLTIRVPEGWKIKSPSRNHSLNSQYGKTSWRWERHDNVFYVNHEYQLFGDPIPKDLYIDYQDFLEAINEQDMVPAILVKK